MNRKTKIVATVSDRRCSVEFIKSLYDAGMNAVRINSAHVTPESASVIVENVRAISDQIPIMIDTKGPEIRITRMDEELEGGFEVATGDIVRVMGSDGSDISTAEKIYMNVPTLYNDVPVSSRLLIDDGEMEIVVVDKKDNALLCEVKNGGKIKPRKSVNIPGVSINLPSITEKDRMFIEWAIEMDLDFIAHSFVRSKSDVLEVKKIIKAKNSPIKVISKIENQEGVDNIDEILLETYGIMVARGDLGVEIPAEQIPVTQRHIVEKCIASKTPVIIATQMLHTMINSPRPTRAEVSDIASAIYQRTDAIMLSGETANGDYPQEAVETMAKVALEIEKDVIVSTPIIDLNMKMINNEITAQLSRSAVRACSNLPIKAIVIDTLSGRTGRYLAAFRGNRPVYAACYNKSIMRQLALSYGVFAVSSKLGENHNSCCFKDIIGHLCNNNLISKDDMLVAVGGSFGASKGATFMEIATASSLECK